MTLASGHAWTRWVPLAGSFDFRLPGRPAPVVFNGRVDGKLVTGTVRQGTARGTFRLTRRARPARAFLGDYALNSGAVVAIADVTGEGASRLGKPLPRRIEAEVVRDGPSGFDPRPWIVKLRIPVLWLYGGLDANQPTALDLEALERLDATGRHDFAWRVYPNGNHGIFEVRTGLSSELGTSRGMPARFFRDLSAWLKTHALAPRPREAP